MYSSIPTPPQSYNPVFYSPSEGPHEDFSIPLLPSDFASVDNTPEEASILKKSFPYQLPTPPPISLLSSQFEAANMASHNIEYQRTLPGTRVSEFSELDPWYTCMYPDYQESATSTRASVSSSAYGSPPTLSLTTNVLGISASYGYSAHPDSGIQVTPHTTLSAKFASSLPSAGGVNISMPRPVTPATTSVPLLASSYTSSVSDATDAWEAHRSIRHHQHVQHHHIDRAATFDTSNWRIPAYPDLNIVQATPISMTATQQWPSPGAGPLRHRSTGLADAAITGRDTR